MASGKKAKQEESRAVVPAEERAAALASERQQAHIKQVVIGESALAATVAEGIIKPLLANYSGDVTKLMMGELLEDIKPASMVERMMAEQMMLTHVQVQALYRKASQAGDYDRIEQILGLVSKMQGEFRKTAKALGEWRTPVQPIIHARQANVANGPQQVINNPPAVANELGGNDA